MTTRHNESLRQFGWGKRFACQYSAYLPFTIRRLITSNGAQKPSLIRRRAHVTQLMTVTLTVSAYLNETRDKFHLYPSTTGVFQDRRKEKHCTFLALYGFPWHYYTLNDSGILPTTEFAPIVLSDRFQMCGIEGINKWHQYSSYH